MAKEKKAIDESSQSKVVKTEKVSCNDVDCPFHGSLKTRGRKFEGYVTKKFPRRIAVEFERVVKERKYDRYFKKKTRLHARLPDCLKDEINIGDYVEVKECRPLSKIIHFVVINKIRSKEK